MGLTGDIALREAIITFFGEVFAVGHTNFPLIIEAPALAARALLRLSTAMMQSIHTHRNADRLINKADLGYSVHQYNLW